MAAATADRNTLQRSPRSATYPVAAAAFIFALTFVCLNADGEAVAATDAANRTFAGVAMTRADNSDGDAGDVTVEVYREGAFKFAASGMGDDDVGRPCYIVDDQTVGVSPNTTHAVLVGTIIEVESATAVWVQLHQAAGMVTEEGGRTRLFTVELSGVNATAFATSGVAARFGGSSFYISDVLAARAVVTSTGAPATPHRKAVTTHYTLSGGVLTAVGDETLNTWLVTFLGRLNP